VEQTWMFIFKRWLVPLLLLCSFGTAQDRPKLRNNFAYIGDVNRHPESSVCRSGELENPETHETYWYSKGITTFSDGTQEVHSIFMGAFHSSKEKKKQRRRALNECATFLDTAER